MCHMTPPLSPSPFLFFHTLATSTHQKKPLCPYCPKPFLFLCVSISSSSSPGPPLCRRAATLRRPPSAKCAQASPPFPPFLCLYLRAPPRLCSPEARGRFLFSYRILSAPLLSSTTLSYPPYHYCAGLRTKPACLLSPSCLLFRPVSILTSSCFLLLLFLVLLLLCPLSPLRIRLARTPPVSETRPRPSRGRRAPPLFHPLSTPLHSTTSFHTDAMQWWRATHTFGPCAHGPTVVGSTPRPPRPPLSSLSSSPLPIL